MKGYRRADPAFSLCGLCCGLCPMHRGGHCPGFGGGEGHQSCAFIRCSRERGAAEFCSQCAQYPCPRFAQAMEYDSFLPHRNMVRDLERFASMGAAAFRAELDEKSSLSETLLAHYNDGRRKQLFTTAVYLLPPPELRQTLAALDAECADVSCVRDRAALAAQCLAAAQAAGLELKLRKSPNAEVLGLESPVCCLRKTVCLL